MVFKLTLVNIKIILIIIFSLNINIYNLGMERVETINCIFLGDKIVGKTQIINCINEQNFSENYLATIEADTTTKLYEFKSNINNNKFKSDIVQYNFLDTSGLEIFRNNIKEYFADQDVLLLVYDITNRDSFRNVSIYLADFREQIKAKTYISILIGNKLDLKKSRSVLYSEGKTFARDNNINYFFEISAKTRSGIQNLESLLKKDIRLKLNKDLLINKTTTKEHLKKDIILNNSNKNEQKSKSSTRCNIF